MPKMMSPKTTIWWVTDPTFNSSSPSAALLTSTANISDAIESGYKLGPTKSDVDKSTAITDQANVDQRTLSNYQGSLTFFRAGDPTDTTSSYYQAFQFFKQGLQTPAATRFGWLVRRVGYPYTLAAAAGQVVDCFYFTLGDPIDVSGKKAAPIQFTMNFYQQGKMALSVPLSA